MINLANGTGTHGKPVFSCEFDGMAPIPIILVAATFTHAEPVVH